MTRALIIHPDATFEITEIESGLSALQSLVGGWIECVDGHDVSIFINEEGRIRGLPDNELATRLWRQTGYQPQHPLPLAGTAVVLGPVDDQGNETPLTDGVMTCFLDMVTR